MRLSSTRIWPSRTSWATLVTVAARLPYWVQGKPARRRRAGWPGWRRPSAAGGGKYATTFRALGGRIAPRASPSRTHRADLQGGRFPKAPRDRRPDAALLDLVPQPCERRGGRGHVAFELGDFALQPLEARQAVALPGLLLRLQPADREAERVGGGPALVDFRPGTHEIELAARPRACKRV